MPSQPALHLARAIAKGEAENLLEIREAVQNLLDNLGANITFALDVVPDEVQIDRLALLIDLVARQTATTVYEVVLDTNWELAQHSFGIFPSQEEAEKFMRDHPLPDKIYKQGVRRPSNGYRVIERTLNEPHMGEFGGETRGTDDKD